MKLKPIITEVIILIVIYIVTRLSLSFLSGSWRTLDINLHDTYFVIEQSAVIIPIFLAFTTIVYLTKEGLHRYKRNLQNLILVIANLLFLIMVYPFSAFLDMMPKPGWTVYPPLPALPNEIGAAYGKEEGTLHFIKQATPIVVIIFMLILVITAILTGKNWNSTKNEQTPA